MKIDKDFAVKVEGKIFTANDISNLSFDIAWFRMECISDNGTRFTVEASLKDVEFLNIPRELKIEVDETRLWNLCDGEYVSKKINCCLEDIKEALSETIETLKTEHHCDIKLEIDGVPFAKMVKKYNGNTEPKTATEACRIANEKWLREEYAARRCKCQCIPYFHNEDMEPKAQNEVVKQAVREAMTEYENKPVTETELSHLEARKRIERDHREATKKWSEAMSSLQTDLAQWSKKASETLKNPNHDWR
jgi:hypothetical protein